MIDYSVLQSNLKNFGPIPPVDDQDWFELNELVVQVHVPENKIVESRPFEREDFSFVLDVAKQCFLTLQLALTAQNEGGPADNEAIFRLMYSSIILCGEHSDSSLWTNDDCIELSHMVLSSVLKILSCDNLNSLLVKTNSSNKLHGVCIFSEIVPKLLNDSWKYHPATVQTYSWLVHQIQLPHMKLFISNVLPIALNIVSDYRVESKILGLNCLRHIISNVSKAELNWHIQIEALQKILKPLYFFRESELIVPVIKCAIEIADKSSSKFKDTGIDLKWSFFDEMLNSILPMMEYEPNVQRKFSYGLGLCILLESSDLSIGRWSQRILRIVEDYAQNSATELEAMKALNLFIKKCWPLMEHHWKRVNLISGRVIYLSNNSEAIAESKVVLKMLKKLLPNEQGIVDAECIEAKRYIKSEFPKRKEEIST